MVISRRTRTYAPTTNVIGAYITFFENSRVPPCVECGLTHARTTGTCLLLPPHVFRNYSFYLCDRLYARRGIYLSRTCTYASRGALIRIFSRGTVKLIGDPDRSRTPGWKLIGHSCSVIAANRALVSSVCCSIEFHRNSVELHNFEITVCISREPAL